MLSRLFVLVCSFTPAWLAGSAFPRAPEPDAAMAADLSRLGDDGPATAPAGDDDAATEGPCGATRVAAVLELRRPWNWLVTCRKLANRSYVAAAFAPSQGTEELGALVRVAAFERDGDVSWRTEERITGVGPWAVYREALQFAEQHGVSLEPIGGRARGLRVSLIGAHGEDAYHRVEVMLVYRRAATGDVYERVFVGLGDEIEESVGDCVAETTRRLKLERDALVIDTLTGGPGRRQDCVPIGERLRIVVRTEASER